MTRRYPRLQIDTGTESLTEQHHKESCDVNTIVRRFAENGVIDHINTNLPRYDYATATTFDEAARMVKAAEEQFGTLPAKVRAHFQNDTATYLDALTDPEQVKDLQMLGLIPKTPEIDSQTLAIIKETPPIQKETPPVENKPTD